MRIPLNENAGNAIARPAPQVQAVPQAFGDGGQALAKAGDMLGQVADDMQAERERIAKEKQAEKAALDRATAANAALDHELAVKTIGQEIDAGLADGSIRHDKAADEYQKRVGKVPKPDTTGYDPVTAMNLERNIKRADFASQSALKSSIDKAVKTDLKVQAEGVLDKLGKQASLPGADPNMLAEQINSMDEIGLRAYGAAWAKRKQDWIDNNWDAHLNQQAMSVRDDMAGIKALQKEVTSGQYSDKLDSNRRNTLVAKLEAYQTSLIQRQEAAAARAERENERRLKQAEAEFNTFQALADRGTIIDPAYIDRAAKLTAGTPYQKGIIQLAKQARETGGIAAQPLAAQQATLDAIDMQIAQQGSTPELVKRREQVKKVLDGSQADLKENGLRAGLERGVIADMAPIDVSNPQGFAATIGNRIAQADHVSMWSGKSVSPLDAREADQLRAMLGSLPAKTRAQAVATIAESVGPRYAGAIAQQLDGQDKALALAFASSGSKTTSGRYTSEFILKGSQAIKDGAILKDDKKVTGWKARIAKAVDGAFPDQRAADAVKEAAYLIAAGIAQENGGSVSGDEIERSVRLAVGGDIIERSNGQRLPIPAQMKAGTFEDKLRSIPADSIARQAPGGKVRVGGAEMDASEFAKSIPGQELVYAGYGKYAVIVRGRPVVNSEGKRILIEVK